MTQTQLPSSYNDNIQRGAENESFGLAAAALSRLDEDLTRSVMLPPIDSVIRRADGMNRTVTAATAAVLTVGALGGVTVVAQSVVSGAMPVAVPVALAPAPPAVEQLAGPPAVAEVLNVGEQLVRLQPGVVAPAGSRVVSNGSTVLAAGTVVPVADTVPGTKFDSSGNTDSRDSDSKNDSDNSGGDGDGRGNDSRDHNNNNDHDSDNNNNDHGNNNNDNNHDTKNDNDNNNHDNDNNHHHWPPPVNHNPDPKPPTDTPDPPQPTPPVVTNPDPKPPVVTNPRPRPPWIRPKPPVDKPDPTKEPTPQANDKPDPVTKPEPPTTSDGENGGAGTGGFFSRNRGGNGSSTDNKPTFTPRRTTPSNSGRSTSDSKPSFTPRRTTSAESGGRPSRPSRTAPSVPSTSSGSSSGSETTSRGIGGGFGRGGRAMGPPNAAGAPIAMGGQVNPNPAPA